MVKFTSISSIIMLLGSFISQKKIKFTPFLFDFLILAIERLSICNLHFKYILTYNC